MSAAIYPPIWTLCPIIHLIWVQLALVHWVGILNDFYLVLSKSLPIETLRRNTAQGLIRFLESHSFLNISVWIRNVTSKPLFGSWEIL